MHPRMGLLNHPRISHKSQIKSLHYSQGEPVVNTIMDAAFRSSDSRQWEPVQVEWRHGTTPRISKEPDYHDGHTVIKKEILPDGRVKHILRHKDDGSFFDLIV